MVGAVRRRPVPLLAASLLVLAGCTSTPSPIPTGRPTIAPSPTRGPIRCGSSGCAAGSIVLAADRWPECLNPITACAASDWTWWTVLEQVLPRAMQLDRSGRPLASPLLTTAPTLANGGLRAGPPFRITYHLRPDAVWADGSPMTSRDFLFTWRAIVSTNGSFLKDRYAAVTSIDASDPHTTVITMAAPDALWFELFGGSRGFLLEAAAFPKLRSSTNPDLRDEMLDDIPFSGGPWILQRWSKHQAVLIPNERSLWPIPILPRVTFVPKPDLDTAITSLTSGEVASIYAEPRSWDDTGGGATIPEIRLQAVPGLEFEALWFNQHRPPMDDRRVREAVAYAIDREALAGFARKLQPDAPVLDCGFVGLPALGTCPSRAFARYAYDPARSRQLLGSAGYDCSGPTCTRDGAPLEIGVGAYEGSMESPLQQALLEQLDRAGFLAKVGVYAGSLFAGSRCPERSFAIVVCRVQDSVGLDLGDLLACSAVPPVGHNDLGWCNPQADDLIGRIRRELDPEVRAGLLSRLYELQADDVIGLPLVAVPVLSAWWTVRIAGPVGQWAGTPYGLYSNVNDWTPAA